MSNIISAINLLKAFNKPGSFIGQITTTGEEDIENRGHPDNEEYKCLGSCFDNSENKRYYFCDLDNHDHYSYYDVQIGETYASRYTEKCSYRADDKTIDKLLENLRKPSEFGDVLKQKTVIDEKVRKGFDVTIADFPMHNRRAKDTKETKSVEINSSLISMLTDLFRCKFGYGNIKVVPYKINIYEKGDFFDEHRDSPTDSLIASIVVNIRGPTENFVIDNNVVWKKEFGNVCMFYTDVLHKVTPVPGYRETLAFNVFLPLHPLPKLFQKQQ
jgi:hypothetical protein